MKTPAAHKRLIGPLKKLSLSACVASFLMLTGCAQAAAARTLADRLAEMDASLSEGRELVVELQNALGERERLLRLASETLAATRKAAE